MKWARLISAISRLLVAFGVKNTQSRKTADAIGDLVDANIEAVDQTLQQKGQ